MLVGDCCVHGHRTFSGILFTNSLFRHPTTFGEMLCWCIQCEVLVQQRLDLSGNAFYMKHLNPFEPVLPLSPVLTTVFLTGFLVAENDMSSLWWGSGDGSCL